jgi:hypothetical protein
MTTIKHPRLRVPGVMAIGGSAIAIASWVSSGWEAALVVELFTVAATIGYYVLGGRDSDAGALFGSRPDERQANVGLRAGALAGSVTSIVAVGGFVIATAVGSATWPFALFCGVGAVSFLAGLLLYRAGG